MEQQNIFPKPGNNFNELIARDSQGNVFIKEDGIWKPLFGSGNIGTYIDQNIIFPLPMPSEWEGSFEDPTVFEIEGRFAGFKVESLLNFETEFDSTQIQVSSFVGFFDINAIYSYFDEPFQGQFMLPLSLVINKGFVNGNLTVLNISLISLENLYKVTYSYNKQHLHARHLITLRDPSIPEVLSNPEFIMNDWVTLCVKYDHEGNSGLVKNRFNMNQYFGEFPTTTDKLGFPYIDEQGYVRVYLNQN